MSTTVPSRSTARAEGTALRVTAGALLVIATIAHIQATFIIPSTLFVVLFVLSALGTALGAVLLMRAARLGWLVGGVVSLLTALGYIQRSTIGFFGLIPPQPFLHPLAGPVSAIPEILVVLLAAWALAPRGTITPTSLREEVRGLLPTRRGTPA